MWRNNTNDGVSVAWSETAVDELEAFDNRTWLLQVCPVDSHSFGHNLDVARQRTVTFFGRYVRGEGREWAVALHTVDRQILAFRPLLSPVCIGGTQPYDLGCVCAVASAAPAIDRSAWDTPSCDIHSLADPDFDSTADLDIDSAANVDSAPDIDPAAGDASGDCCGGLGRQAGVAVTR